MKRQDFRAFLSSICFGSESGSAYFIVIAVAAISTALAVSMGSIISNGFKAHRTAELRGDMLTVKTQIQNTIDCQFTFADYGITDIASSSTSQCGDTTSSHSGGISTYLRLKRRKTDNTAMDLGTWNSTTHINKLGEWSVLVGCSKSLNSFVVTAAKLGPDGNPIKNPLTGDPTTWTTLFPSTQNGYTDKICGTSITGYYH